MATHTSEVVTKMAPSADHVRRLVNGTIDYDHYKALARRERRAAIAHVGSKLAALFRSWWSPRRTNRAVASVAEQAARDPAAMAHRSSVPATGKRKTIVPQTFAAAAAQPCERVLSC